MAALATWVAVFGIPVFSFVFMYIVLQGKRNRGLASFCFAIIIWTFAILLLASMA